ncbi:MFS transporter [Azospirillum halopraeferens]|uniref:MFS transporter n=1 Tax=Azospirillum halopraeferens TaxID=34010 RepID=UPI0003FBC382|nr:MFS transporter [Azospirillum halopraeferens]
MGRETRNVVLLAVCMALGMSATALIFTAAAVVGTIIAPDRGLATLPIAVMFIGLMATTLPAAWLVRRLGRRTAFVSGALAGMAGGAIAFLAVLWGWFTLFCAGMLLLGVSAAFTQQYRFAAAEMAAPARRARAISWVTAGGLLSAFLGPGVAVWTSDLFLPARFAGTFAVLVPLQAAVLVLLAFVDLPPRTVPGAEGPARPLRRIAAQPLFLAAVSGGVFGYVGMNLVMTPTPLAVMDCGYAFGDAAFILQWHIVGMYLPAFFTGSLIARFGAIRVMLAGAGLYVACGVLNVAGTDLMLSFWPSLVALGVGWAFLFVGGTALLTETYTPAERARVQGMNDFVVFTGVALSALTSGGVYAGLGWAANNLLLIALALSATLILLWAMRAGTPAAAPA